MNRTPIQRACATLGRGLARMLSRNLRTTLLGLTIAGVVVGPACGGNLLEVEGPDEGPKLQENSSLLAAQLAESSIAFAMNKWLDAAGTTKAAVKGHFGAFEVILSRSLVNARGIEDLSDLTARIHVDLTAVETDLPFRDDNIERAYFETSAFAGAVFTLSKVRPQGQGSTGRVWVDGELDLHGFSVSIPNIELELERTDSAWKVRTVRPIAVRSADFELPVRALLTTCGHLGIDDSATIEVALAILHDHAR